jgi:hypothetical protein
MATVLGAGSRRPSRFSLARSAVAALMIGIFLLPAVELAVVALVLQGRVARGVERSG